MAEVWQRGDLVFVVRGGAGPWSSFHGGLRCGVSPLADRSSLVAFCSERCDFVCYSPVDSAKVRSFLQAVWFDGSVTCIAMSKSSVPTLLVPMTMMLVSVVSLVGGVVEELSYLTTLSVLQEKS
jgi:hypothetical protein